MKPATAVRWYGATMAALNLAARRDQRVTSPAARRNGLSGISRDFAFYNMQPCSDDQARSGRRRSHRLCLRLYVEVAAVQLREAFFGRVPARTRVL